jgi:hypothetical protein
MKCADALSDCETDDAEWFFITAPSKTKNLSMKTILFTIVVFFSCWALPPASVYAQDSSNVKSLPLVTVTSETRKIPNHIWKSFSTYFNEAENPRWYKANKNYLVKFMIYDEENRALFTKRGHMIYHISYGYENNLPDEIYKQVRTAYFDYDITRAIRVNEADRIIWVVNLEDASTIIIARLENGELEEVQRLKKQE